MDKKYIRHPFTFDRVVRILFGALIVVAVFYILNMLKGVLLPFLVACLIAYLLEPGVKWHMRLFHTSRRFIPVMLTLLEAVAAIIIFLWLFIPYITNEVTEMAQIITKHANTQYSIPFVPNKVVEFIRDNVDWNYISKLLTKEEWINIVRNTISSSWSFLNSSLSLLFGIISWMIVILYVIFVMLDYDHLKLTFRQLVPPRQRRTAFRIIDDVKSAMNRYFRGQALIAFIVGILFSIGFTIVGLPMSIVLGLFIGVLNMVPYLQTISFPVTALLCLVYSVDTGIDFWLLFWESIAVYLIVQIIQDLYLTPKIMGKAMGLNPAIILLSLSIWGTLLGLLGMIIALPLTTLLLSYYDKYVVQRSLAKTRHLNNQSAEGHQSDYFQDDSQPGDLFE